MERDDARRLLPLVNDPINLELIKFYAECRIRWHKKELETCPLVEVQDHQGSIRELRKLCDIREHVQSKAI